MLVIYFMIFCIAFFFVGFMCGASSYQDKLDHAIHQERRKYEEKIMAIRKAIKERVEQRGN